MVHVTEIYNYMIYVLEGTQGGGEANDSINRYVI